MSKQSKKVLKLAKKAKEGIEKYLNAMREISELTDEQDEVHKMTSTAFGCTLTLGARVLLAKDIVLTAKESKTNE